MQFPRWPSHFVALAGATLALSSLPARAQNPVAPSGAPESASNAVPEVSSADLAALSLPAFGAVSLRAGLAAMQEAPASSQALRAWVGRGNVVFLHTDAAQMFGIQTVAARPPTTDAGGQLVGRARAALPFGSHPLLRGATEAGAPAARGADPTRLPGVQTVFYSLREGDALATSSDVATPLLQTEDGSEGDQPLYAAVIASVGAGWAIFCPDTLDSGRGDGAAFGRALLSFVPNRNGARYVGLPARVLLGADASPALASAALQSRLGAALRSDGSAALPSFGTAPATATAPIETGSEAVLPLERDEARAISSALDGPDAVSVSALLKARLQWQLGQSDQSARALRLASLDPRLAPQVSFWNGCFQTQIASDVSLDAPLRSLAFDGAARAFSRVGNSNFALGTGAKPSFNRPLSNGQTFDGQPVNGGFQNGRTFDGQLPVGQLPEGRFLAGAPRIGLLPLPVAPLVAALWSREFARLAAVYTLAPPQSQFIPATGASATLRFYAGDSGASVVASLLQSAVGDANGLRAPHIEVMLLPSAAAYAGMRRALGAPSSATLPGGEVVGTTLLLASGEGVFGLLSQSADAATLARGLALAKLNACTDGGRPLPSWISVGAQGRAVELRPQGASSQADPDVLVALLRGQAPASAETATALWTFLLNQYGTGAGEELVARLSAGASLDQALQAATGDDTSAFIDAFRRA